jgi:hypothetical protein
MLDVCRLVLEHALGGTDAYETLTSDEVTVS